MSGARLVRVIARDPKRPGVIFLMHFPTPEMADDFVGRLRGMGCTAQLAGTCAAPGAVTWCPQCGTQLAFDGDVCDLCNPDQVPDV